MKAEYTYEIKRETDFPDELVDKLFEHNGKTYRVYPENGERKITFRTPVYGEYFYADSAMLKGEVYKAITNFDSDQPRVILFPVRKPLSKQFEELSEKTATISVYDVYGEDLHKYLRTLDTQYDLVRFGAANDADIGYLFLGTDGYMYLISQSNYTLKTKRPVLIFKKRNT